MILEVLLAPIGRQRTTRRSAKGEIAYAARDVQGFLAAVTYVRKWWPKRKLSEYNYSKRAGCAVAHVHPVGKELLVQVRVENHLVMLTWNQRVTRCIIRLEDFSRRPVVKMKTLGRGILQARRRRWSPWQNRIQAEVWRTNLAALPRRRVLRRRPGLSKGCWQIAYKRQFMECRKKNSDSFCIRSTCSMSLDEAQRSRQWK